MTTHTLAELLTVALTDLRDARRVVRERLPGVAAGVADAESRAALEEIADEATREERALDAMAGGAKGDPNLWAAGIMDDAERDIASTAHGTARDVALIGAIRKVVAADIVSLETAILLDHGDAALARLHADALGRDAGLRGRLEELTRG